MSLEMSTNKLTKHFHSQTHNQVDQDENTNIQSKAQRIEEIFTKV